MKIKTKSRLSIIDYQFLDRQSTIEQMRGSRPIRILLSVIALGMVLITIGCDKTEGPSEAKVTADDLVQQGWSNFENLDYTASLNDFEAAIDLDDCHSDAHNGAGWSAGKIHGKLKRACDYFAISFSLDTTRYDALGGWVFAVYQQGDWEAAIRKGDSLLYRRQVWQFHHEQTIDFNDIRLVMAVSYFNLGEFEQSLRNVQMLNSSFEADMNTPIGRRELRDEIERLRKIYA